MAYEYDPSEVFITWEGENFGFDITGFAPNTFISIEFTSPQYSTVEGLDGNVAFLPKHVLSATITLTLQQGGFGNENLTQASSNQDRDVLTMVQGNLTVTDLSGSYNLLLANAVLVNQATVNFAKTAADGTREWVFYSPHVSYKKKVDEVSRGRSSLQRLISSVFG